MTDRKARFWAAVPAVLLGTLTGSLGIVAYITSSDPSFAIERDYYVKAIDYDREREQAEVNRELGWKVDLSTHSSDENIELDAVVRDARGRPVDGAAIRVEAFPVARSANPLIAHFALEPGKAQHARLPLVTSGLWELRFTVDARDRRFTQILRRDIGSIR